jgi:hypothetical protein
MCSCVLNRMQYRIRSERLIANRLKIWKSLGIRELDIQIEIACRRNQDEIKLMNPMVPFRSEYFVFSFFV